MKAGNKSTIDISTWQQVSSKIKNSDADKRRENENFSQKVGYVIGCKDFNISEKKK